MRDILEGMKNMGIFMAVSHLIIQFCPSKEYEKYIKTICGIITVVILAMPVFKLFSEDTVTEFQAYLEICEQEFEAASGQNAWDTGASVFDNEGIRTALEESVDGIWMEMLEESVSE